MESGYRQRGIGESGDKEGETAWSIPRRFAFFPCARIGHCSDLVHYVKVSINTAKIRAVAVLTSPARISICGQDRPICYPQIPRPNGGFALNRRPPNGLMCSERLPSFGKTMTIEKKISGDSLELMLSERIDGTAPTNSKSQSWPPSSKVTRRFTLTWHRLRFSARRESACCCNTTDR